VLDTNVTKVNECFILNDIALVDTLRYNLFSISQLCDADLSVLFHKSDSHIFILLANVFVTSLTLETFFKFISHMLNFL
jgi:hypothetical protein